MKTVPATRWKSRLRGRISIVLLGTVFGVAPVATSQERPPVPAPPPPLPSITVVGSGTASARPDSAEITAGVVTQSTTAAQALAQNSASMDKVQKAAAALGIAEKDIQTTNISVAPQWRQSRPEGQPSEIVGYVVSNQIRVKVRDLVVLGRLVDEVVSQGANAVGSIHFSVADPAPVLDQARQKAVADARRKADVYANAAGVKLGQVLSIWESTPGLPRFEGQRMLATSAVPVAPGEQEFQASVSITYAIK